MFSRSSHSQSNPPSFDGGFSSDSFGGGFGDSFQDPSGMADPFSQPAGGAPDPLSGFDNSSPFTFSDEGAGPGSGGPGGPRRSGGGPNRIWIILLIAAAILLTVILCMGAFSSKPVQTFSPGHDAGEISVSSSLMERGQYYVQLTHELTGLDPLQIYVAGFMMAPEGQSLVAINEPAYISRTDRYTASAEIIITRPGTYQLAFYSYSLANPIPSITATQIIEIGGGATQTLQPDETAIILITPEPTPTPTATPTPAPVQPQITTAPTAAITPSSDLFRLYDVSTRFYYNQMTDAQKRIFAEMYDGVANGETNISLTPCARPDYEMALEVLRYDCPELFHWDYESDRCTYSYNGYDQVVAFKPSEYAYSVSEHRSKLNQIMSEIRSLSGLAGFGSSDYSKQLAIYDYIIRESTYNKERPYCAYADSVYLYGYSKCTGYAYALNLALRYYGIPCAVVIGDTYDNGVLAPTSHMWSIARIDGMWYHCDATWDDNDDPLPRHAYLNLNDRLMFAARIPRDEHEDLLLPSCTSTAANAMMREGVYVSAGTSVESVIVRELADALASGGGRVQFLFESGADCSTALILLQRDDISDKIARAANAGFSTQYYYHTDVNYIDVRIKRR